MRVVLDTNVLLVSISSRSSLHWVFKALIQKKFELYLTSEILLEYEEIIAQHMGTTVSTDVVATLESLSNVKNVSIYYDFNLLKDQDDNKFVNCAIAAQADYIVTHDSDFNLLKKIDFPKVNCIDSASFKKFLSA